MMVFLRMFSRGIRSQRWMPTYPSSDNDPFYRVADGKPTFEYGK
jgi:hypothetical protein